MEPSVVVIAIAVLVAYNYFWKRRFAAPVFRQVLEGTIPPTKGALWIVLSMPHTLVFPLGIIASVVQSGLSLGVLILVGMWALAIIGGTWMWRVVLVWQIAHPSKLGWWRGVSKT